jgi:hypothetical protein
VFEEPEDPSNRSFFSEIISSISDVKFSHSGRYMMTRDYLSVKIWDLNMENRPVETYQVFLFFLSKVYSYLLWGVSGEGFCTLIPTLLPIPSVFLCLHFKCVNPYMLCLAQCWSWSDLLPLASVFTALFAFPMLAWIHAWLHFSCSQLFLLSLYNHLAELCVIVYFFSFVLFLHWSNLFLI